MTYSITCDGGGQTWTAETPLPVTFEHHHESPLGGFLQIEAKKARRRARRNRETFVVTGIELVLSGSDSEDWWPHVRHLKRHSDLPDKLKHAERRFPVLASARECLSAVEYRKLVTDLNPQWRQQVRIPKIGSSAPRAPEGLNDPSNVGTRKGDKGRSGELWTSQACLPIYPEKATPANEEMAGAASTSSAVGQERPVSM